EPCIHEWMTHMKVSVVGPFEASTVTFWVYLAPGFSPVNQESPFLLRLPSVSHPALPALAGFLVGGPLPLTPCHSATALQMCFGVKQAFRSFLVCGWSASITIENVWGPTSFGLVLFSIVSDSPSTIVFG